VLIDNTNNAWAYFPLSFLTDRELSFAQFQSGLTLETLTGQVQKYVSSEGISIFFKKLQWDSEFFGIPTFRIEYASIPSESSERTITNSFDEFRESLSSINSEFYVFAEIPSEDTAVLVGMTGSRWRLVETRITCFHDDMENFNFSNGLPTRSAVKDDIPVLKSTSIEAVNPFDRFHADSFFSGKQADDFMAAFIENSVNGFADEVIVPATGNADAFVTGKYLHQLESIGVIAGKNVLTAVSTNRKGWYSHLIEGLCNRFVENGVYTAIVTTQSTNRPVHRVLFNHGFRFGRVTHIVATYVLRARESR